MTADGVLERDCTAAGPRVLRDELLAAGPGSALRRGAGDDGCGAATTGARDISARFAVVFPPDRTGAPEPDVDGLFPRRGVTGAGDRRTSGVGAVAAGRAGWGAAATGGLDDEESDWMTVELPRDRAVTAEFVDDGLFPRRGVAAMGERPACASGAACTLGDDDVGAAGRDEEPFPLGRASALSRPGRVAAMGERRTAPVGADADDVVVGLETTGAALPVRAWSVVRRGASRTADSGRAEREFPPVGD